MKAYLYSFRMDRSDYDVKDIHNVIVDRMETRPGVVVVNYDDWDTGLVVDAELLLRVEPAICEIVRKEIESASGFDVTMEEVAMR